MIEWFKEKYEKSLPIVAVFIIVLSALRCLLAGVALGQSDSEKTFYAFLFFLLGIGLGIICCIFTFGLIGVVLEIRDLLRTIANQRPVSNEKVSIVKEEEQKADYNKSEPSKWRCNCGCMNSNDTLFCVSCGKLKG